VNPRKLRAFPRRGPSPCRGLPRRTLLAKPNYSFEKRQRELAKKKKHEQKLEQKRQQKLAKTGDGEPAPEPDNASTEAGSGTST
jgi:hypothetical protein